MSSLARRQSRRFPHRTETFVPGRGSHQVSKVRQLNQKGDYKMQVLVMKEQSLQFSASPLKETTP